MNIPDNLYPRVVEILNAESNAAFTKEDEAERRCLWAVILNVLPVKEPDGWCLQYGDIIAKGNSPIEAMANFEALMEEEIKPEVK